MEMKRVAALALQTAALAWLGCISGREVALVAPASSAPVPVAIRSVADPAVFWEERFDGPSLAWVSPFGHSSEQVREVYSIVREQGMSFLRARHDARVTNPRRVPAINFGKRFDPEAPDLDRIASLRWKWRVLQHPAIDEDPWLDLGASLYVIVQHPTLLRKGKGFKFGWVAHPGPADTTQMGLAQIELRSDPADGQWRQEQVDVCAMYRKLFGPCEGEKLEWVGVLTDADGSHSVAQGDYADFELVMTRPARVQATSP
jgi:hypothetical protein